MSGPHTIIGHRNWTIQPDHEPDAEPISHEMECAVCGERSGAADSWEKPQTWALEHSGRNPSHVTFREIIKRPWKTWMRP